MLHQTARFRRPDESLRGFFNGFLRFVAAVLDLVTLDEDLTVRFIIFLLPFGKGFSPRWCDGVVGNVVP